MIDGYARVSTDALDDLDSGDELVIAEWDRATRSMWDGLPIIKAHDRRRSPLAHARFGLAACAVLLMAAPTPAAQPCGGASASADARARQTFMAMTEGEKLALIHGDLGAPWKAARSPGRARLGGLRRGDSAAWRARLAGD